MCFSTDSKSTTASGPAVGPTYSALKNRLRWRIRRARKAVLDRARAQVISVKLSRLE